MPVMTYETKTYNDQSVLSDGWHPAFLLDITDEETPATWKMFEASPRMWRWHFAVWGKTEEVAQYKPERQSAPSAQKFVPKGKNPPSKAYQWTKQLLNRDILPGEGIDLVPLCPFPCRVKVERKGEYANIVDVEAWEDGRSSLTDALRAKLQAFTEAPPQEQQSSPLPRSAVQVTGSPGALRPAPSTTGTTTSSW